MLTDKQLTKALEQLNECYSLDYVAKGLQVPKPSLNRQIIDYRRKLKENEEIV